MSTANKKLLPLRDYSEHDVINMYAYDSTGLAGILVKVSVSDLDQQNYWDSSANVGQSFDGVLSKSFVNNNRVTAATSGDTALNILGLTLVDVRTVDDNGIPLFANKRGQAELAAVYSGETVPVVKKGLFSIRTSEVEGTPGIGKVVVPATGAAGKLAAVDASSVLATGYDVTAGTYPITAVLGKWLSGTGSRQGGYADFLLDL